MELVGAAYKQDVARSITALQDRGYNVSEKQGGTL